MRTAYRKVVRDLWRNRGRTILVIVSIAVGVMAVGMIISSNGLIDRQMTRAQIASQPAHVVLYLNGLISDEEVRAISRLPEVEDAVGRADRGIRWKLSIEDEWDDASLIAIDDYDEQRLDVFELKAGSWPEADSVVLAASHVEPYALPDIGAELFLEINDRARPFNIAGILRDHHQAPPPFVNNAAFYVTRTSMKHILGEDRFDEIRLTVPEFSQKAAEEAAEVAEAKLERQGVFVNWTQIQEPDRHWAQDIMDGVGLILTIMAVASLFLSVILVVNTINALIAQQIPQIGIMKTVGGISRQISRLYLASVIVYGVLSLLLAVPLGAFGGSSLARWLLTLLNVPTAPFEFLSGTLLIQAAAGLAVPLVAALYPVLQGVAISVREALSVYGVGSGNYGKGLIDRSMGRVRGIPRLPILAVRNTFRRAGRVALTEIVLVTAGAIFMLVISTHFSFTNTIAEIWRGLGFDANMGFSKLQRIDEIEPLIAARPNVERVEMWVWSAANGLAPENSEVEEQRIFLRGIPRDTEMFTPNLVAGRNLDPGDGHALLLNQKLATEMELEVGDDIELDFGNNQVNSWTIVGLIFDLTGNQASAYMHIDTLSQELNQIGRATAAQIRATDNSRSGQLELIEDLETYFKSIGNELVWANTAIEDQEQAESQFNILTTILMTMTVVMAIVGSIGLSGTLSINVIERRREIGVMRAVGASSFDVAMLFVGEGLMLGLLSWALAVPISIVLGRPFVTAIGTIIEFPAQYLLSPQGYWLWLMIVVVLSIVASWLPSRRATKISVNESLAYE